MDIWSKILSTRLEAPEFEFTADFVGGKILVQKDYLDDEETSTTGWLIHVYFKPSSEFEDRPIVADLCIRYGSRRREVMSVLLHNNSFFGHVRSQEKNGRLILGARIRRMLCGLDLQQPSSSRRFIVQNFDANLKDSFQYYVNVTKLDMMAGGDLFKKWKAQEEVGIVTIIEHMEQQLIDALMEATAKYDDLIILKHAVDKLVKLAKKFRMHTLMRAIEDYITETKLLSWDEKILLAIQYRMTPLYVLVQRKFLTSPWTTLCRVQRLLLTAAQLSNSQDFVPFQLIHKHFLELVMFSDENVVIG